MLSGSPDMVLDRDIDTEQNLIKELFIRVWV